MQRHGKQLHAAPEPCSHHLVAPAKALAILRPELRRNARLAVLVAIGRIGPAMVVPVSSRSVHAVTEAALPTSEKFGGGAHWPGSPRSCQEASPERRDIAAVYPRMKPSR